MEWYEEYGARQPYPKLPPSLPENRETARMLQGDYAGPVSELTAVTQYMYHSMVLKEQRPDVARALEGIAIIEMRHLELLGKAMLALGLEPRYLGADQQEWRAGYNYYEKDIHRQLEADLRAEEEAIRVYNDQIASLGHLPALQDLLRIIVADEEAHVRYFQQVLASLPGQAH